MAAVTENLSDVAPVNNGVVDDDSKYGFQRPEMYQTALKGTVDAYDRHVFLCYKGPEAWPAKVEDEADSLPKVFAAAVKARRKDFHVKISIGYLAPKLVWLLVTMKLGFGFVADCNYKIYELKAFVILLNIDFVPFQLESCHLRIFEY
ncbi:hypothetical protein QQ045_000153 [Rhodiola kirilowii]